MAFGDDHPFHCNLKCFQPKSAYSAGDTGDVGLIPRSGISPGVGNDNPLQYSGLENPMDCIIYGVGGKELDTTERL